MASLHIRDFPHDLKKSLKMIALIRDISLYQLIIDIMTEYVKNHKS